MLRLGSTRALIRIFSTEPEAVPGKLSSQLITASNAPEPVTEPVPICESLIPERGLVRPLTVVVQS
jgi:hypothetical protein